MNSQSRKTSVRGITEDYITQLSEDIKGRVTEKLSQGFSRTEYHLLGAMSKLNEFSLELADTDTLRNRSGNISERRSGKQGTNWSSFPV